MARYALIRGRKVINVVEQSTMPIGGVWVDVTGLPVGPGSIYEGDLFSAPVATVRLSVRDFLRRWTQAEREALENAIVTGNPTLKKAAAALRTYLLAGPEVELNDPIIVAGMAAMEQGNVLGNGRASAILN